MRILLSCCILCGCAGTEANHIGNPLLLPIGAVTTGVENSVYNARRKRVADYVAANHASLRADVLAGEGLVLEGLFKVAKTPKAKQAALLQELYRGQSQYFAGDIEPMVVAVMVHS